MERSWRFAISLPDKLSHPQKENLSACLSKALKINGWLTSPKNRNKKSSFHQTSRTWGSSRNFPAGTLPETNIAPESRPSQKETSIPTIHFQLLC